MKKYITTVVIIGLVVGCSSPTKTSNAVGFSTINAFENGMVIGNQADVDTWLAYLDLHNKKDLEGIREMNHDSIFISDASGNVIFGNDKHIAFLEEWFESGVNPAWNPIWGTSVKEADDENGSMVLAVAEMTLQQGDSSVYVNQNFDAYIQNGKVRAFWITHRDLNKFELDGKKAQ